MHLVCTSIYASLLVYVQYYGYLEFIAYEYFRTVYVQGITNISYKIIKLLEYLLWFIINFSTRKDIRYRN